MVGELVIGYGQNQDSLSPPPQVDEIDNLLVEAEARDGLVQVVDGGDAGQLPVELVQHQKLPFL